MALYFRRLLISALLVLTVASVNADDEIPDDEVTIETVEDNYQSPKLDSKSIYLTEHFDDVTVFKKKWIKSEAKKQGVDETIAKYDGKWEVQSPSRRILKNDLGLVLMTEAKHAAISALLDRPFEFKDKPLIVQYEVTMQEGQNCGGAYIKLLSRGMNTKADLRQFHDQTPYTIMFGPDKCGNDNKLHFIFRHVNPINGTIEEKHSKKPTQRLDDFYKDKEPHLYTLIVRPDNTFTILVDNKEANAGSLLEDFTPPVNPPEEIDDPNDKKPADWDEREKIVDPTATKPEDWDEDAPAQIVDPNAVKPDNWLEDEPETIPDPDATKPSDWDEEMDGEWEAPLVDNPACAAAAGCGPWAAPAVPNPDYKGPWRAPLVSNPNYRGRWTPRRIRNPHYFRDDTPFRMTPVHAVGFELWSMSPMLLFDNIIITDDERVAEEWAKMSYAIKRAKLTSDSRTWWGRTLRATSYRPGMWALYALYCALPVALYVLYLRRRAQESLVERVLKYSGENPWVYGVVIVGSFLIVGFVAYMCCMPKTDTDSITKKTDALVDDDPQQSDGEMDVDGDSPEGEAEAEVEEERGTSERRSKAGLEGHEENEEVIPHVDTEGAGDGQRKRKPRKE